MKSQVLLESYIFEALKLENNVLHSHKKQLIKETLIKIVLKNQNINEIKFLKKGLSKIINTIKTSSNLEKILVLAILSQGYFGFNFSNKGLDQNEQELAKVVASQLKSDKSVNAQQHKKYMKKIKTVPLEELLEDPSFLKFLGLTEDDVKPNTLSQVFAKMLQNKASSGEVAFAQDEGKSYTFYSQEELQRYLDNPGEFMSGINSETEITQFNQRILDEELDINDIKEMNKDSESWDIYTNIMLKSEYKLDKQNRLINDLYVWLESETDSSTRSQMQNEIQNLENDIKNTTELIKDANELVGIDSDAYQVAIDSLETTSIRALESNKELFSKIMEIETDKNEEIKFDRER